MEATKQVLDILNEVIEKRAKKALVNDAEFIAAEVFQDNEPLRLALIEYESGKLTKRDFFDWLYGDFKVLFKFCLGLIDWQWDYYTLDQLTERVIACLDFKVDRHMGEFNAQ